MTWSGGLVDWVEGDTAYVSVVFSWRLPDAYQRAIWYKAQGYKVRAGGPGVYARPKYLADVAQIGGDVEAITHHNPRATVASRGCPVGCSFCIVPAMEGREFTLLWDFTPLPVLMDNNLSALPVEFQEHIIRRYLETGTPLEDAQEGFEPSAFDSDTFRRWSKIIRGKSPWRFAFDTLSEEEPVRRMAHILRDVPAFRKRTYVLIGNEPKSACYERIVKTIEMGCEPHVQPMIALNALQKRPMVRHDWTERELTDMARWANRRLWRTIPLSEYRPRAGDRPFAGAAL